MYFILLHSKKAKWPNHFNSGKQLQKRPNLADLALLKDTWQPWFAKWLFQTIFQTVVVVVVVVIGEADAAACIYNNFWPGNEKECVCVCVCLGSKSTYSIFANNTLTYSHTSWGQFHQRSTSSFYTCRYQKRKKRLSS